MADLFLGTGRRKRAVARVRLELGQGVITINRKPLDEYFTRDSLKQIVRQPLEATNEPLALRHQRQDSRAAGSPAKPARCVTASPARCSTWTSRCASRSAAADC